jgi:AcrR family transcriptional regulator
VSPSGEKTREKLIEQAERLFGERGVNGPSLREIRLAAGAKNTAALQYHFGDRDGLLDALAARHMPRIAELQESLLRSVVDAGRGEDPRSLVEVLVGPIAMYLQLGDSERAWVKIMADLAALPDLHLNEMEAVTPQAGIKAGQILYERVAQYLPATIARERIVLVAQTGVHLCADYARVLDNPELSRQHVTPAAFTENLVDMMTAALLTPMSSATTATLGAKERRPG